MNTTLHPLIAEERRSLLLEELNESGFLQIQDISKKMDISPITIRRDLTILESEGLCHRKRGGAVKAFVNVSTELPYDIRRNQNDIEKREIGEAAAKLVNNGSTIILDSGSTTFALSLFLRTKSRLVVVTNDLQIAVKLANFSNIQTICTGGSVRSHMFSLQGIGTVNFINDLKVDICFLGADAIETDLSISNVTYEEVSIKRAMIKAAKKVVLVADSTKFYRSGFVKVCDFEQIDTVITDDGIASEQLYALQQSGVKYLLVKTPSRKELM
jgi:DeoR/GlpR family transcriptional regulator of sugar metabolism